MKNDLISRQKIIDALKVAYWDNDIQSAKDDPCIVDAMTDWAIRQVKALPSAQPERKKGKWEDYSDEGFVECPFCHSATNCDGNKDELKNFDLEDDPECQMELKAYQDIRNGIKKEPTIEPEPHWIPCSERLPEEYGEYRITWTTSVSKKPFLGDAEYEVSSEWDSKYDRFKGEWLLADYVNEYPDVKVTAWKPMEEPYQPESEE